MKKDKRPSKLTIKRLSSSPYFQDQFLISEQEQLKAALDVEFVDTDTADIFITNTHTNLEALTPEQLKNCKLILHPNSGYDNYRASFVNQHSLPIIIGHTIRSQAVANFILSALISHYTPLPKHTQWNRERKWNRKVLSELTVMIIGQGHIGNILKTSLTPLCHEIRVYDPYLGLNLFNLKNVDVVLLACSLNEKNKWLINQNVLSQLQTDYLIINAARGPLIKTSDLIESLKNNKEAFAFLDVFENEPCDFKIFESITNISLTSHIAGVYRGIDQATINFEINLINDFMNLDRKDFNLRHSNLLLSSHLSVDKNFLI